MIFNRHAQKQAPTLLKVELYCLSYLTEKGFFAPYLYRNRQKAKAKKILDFFLFPFYYELETQNLNFLKINLAQNIPQSVVIVFEKKAQSASCFY